MSRSLITVDKIRYQSVIGNKGLNNTGGSEAEAQPELLFSALCV